MAVPPRLLRTVMFCGLLDNVKRPLYLPPPSLLSVPISWLVEVMYTLNVALELVLIASTLNSLLLVAYSTRVMVTESLEVGVGVRVGVDVACGGGGADVAVGVGVVGGADVGVGVAPPDG